MYNEYTFTSAVYQCPRLCQDRNKNTLYFSSDTILLNTILLKHCSEKGDLGKKFIFSVQF